MYRQRTHLPFGGLRIQILPLKAPVSGSVSLTENRRMDQCAAFISEDSYPAPPSAQFRVGWGRCCDAISAFPPTPLVPAASIPWGLRPQDGPSVGSVMRTPSHRDGPTWSRQRGSPEGEQTCDPLGPAAATSQTSLKDLSEHTSPSPLP